MSEKVLNITIGGEAGQGLVTIGELLAKALVLSGYEIVVTQSYQSRVRGGHNTFTVRVSNRPIHAPQESIDLLVALNDETVQLHRSELSEQAFIITSSSIRPDDVATLNVPLKDLTSARYENVAAAGVVTYLLGLDQSIPANVLQDLFGKKGEKVMRENREALAAAYTWASQEISGYSFDVVDVLKLPPVRDRSRRLFLNGNECIALGAMSAGVKFCAFYPMTPATSIPLTLNKHAEMMGLVVEQAEDEIAAINMALGASFAGAPSMVATSGGGFALMVESVSLAGMTETPIVIVVSQRPGPATGLPTRTEQGDLEFVLYSGHGEFPRAIFAPGFPEECFHLTRKAFQLAERYQGPVFLLSDQFLADSYRAVAPFDVVNMEPVIAGADPTRVKTPYKRYALEASGVSPRLLPGASEHLVIADSDEHDELGHLTEDLSIRIRMVDKRLKKNEGLRLEAIPPSYDGSNESDLLLVSWGSTKGSVLEAAAALRSSGSNVGVLHFSQVWPLVADHFLERLTNARKVVAIESNATGQFARLILRETGFKIRDLILRYDGLPITPEYILRHLDA